MIVPYLGEKSKFSNFIKPNIPSDIKTYVEPFGGMFGIFFSLDLSKYKDVKFVYNDVNYLNYNLFNYLRYNDDFPLLISDIKVDKSKYLESLKSITLNENKLKLAIDWLIVLCCSSPYEVGKDSWRNDSEFEIFKLKFKAYKYHLDKVNNIHNLDYKEVIEKYDSPSTFFYVDPPYMGKERHYINHGFSGESHIELAKILNNIKGKFLLSYYYFNGLEKLYENCRFDSKMTIMGTELIIMNF
jgi:DNA adenine methylase